MGWKLVRDRNEEWCRANGVSGQWRTSPDPRSALLKKIFEEAGEYAEHRDPAELYDLLEVVEALIDLEDPDGGKFARAHGAKVREMGSFGQLIEWCPVPGAGDNRTEAERRAVDEAIEALRERLAGDGN